MLCAEWVKIGAALSAVWCNEFGCIELWFGEVWSSVAW